MSPPPVAATITNVLHHHHLLPPPSPLPPPSNPPPSTAATTYTHHHHIPPATSAISTNCYHQQLGVIVYKWLEENIESVIGINKDDIDEEDDESSTMEPPSRNEAIKAAITLNNFLLSYEKTTPEVLTMLRKIRDEIQGEIDFNKKQKTIEHIFRCAPYGSVTDWQSGAKKYVFITVNYRHLSHDSEPWRFVRGSGREPAVAAPPNPPLLPIRASPDHPPLLVYVLEPEYLEYFIPYGDKAPIEDQPLPADASPKALSPSYVDDFDPEEDPESPQIIVPPSQTRLRKAWKTVRPQTPIPFPSEAEVDRILALPTPPPSPLTPLSYLLPQIPSPQISVSSPPLPLPSPLTTSLTDVGTFWAIGQLGIQIRSFITPRYYYHLLTIGYDIPEVRCRLRRGLLYYTTFGFEVGESSAASVARQPGPTLEADLRRDRVREMGYGITDTWDEIVEAMLEITPTILEGVNQKVTELATTVRQDYTDKFYGRFESAKTLEANVADIDGQTFLIQTQLTTFTWMYSGH
ncbi:hypothetical protein Tco_1215937 [Tanacetum coccineum]